jgi:hypothetical protein
MKLAIVLYVIGGLFLLASLINLILLLMWGWPLEINQLIAPFIGCVLISIGLNRQKKEREK